MTFEFAEHDNFLKTVPLSVSEHFAASAEHIQTTPINYVKGTA